MYKNFNFLRAEEALQPLHKSNESMLLGHRIQRELLLCLFPVPKPGKGRFGYAFKDRERKTNFQLYREKPSLNYLFNSLLAEDGREMKSRDSLSSRDKTFPQNESKITGKKFKYGTLTCSLENLTPCVS